MTIGLVPVLAETTFEERLDLPADGSFVLDADLGEVVVRGGSAEGVVVTVRSDRDDLRDHVKFDFVSGPSEARVTATKIGSESEFRRWARSQNGARLKFEVEVPSGAAVTVDTSGGKIAVADVRGPVRADTSGGQIELSRIGADVFADTSGGSIRVEEIGGNAELDTSGGSIRASRVTGTVDADTSGGSIVMEEIGGDAKADTSGGSIEIENAAGRVVADTSGGGIEVAFAPGNDRGGVLDTSGGGVTVHVDPTVGLSIDAATSGGPVRTELPVKFTGSMDRGELRGTLNGGGASLKLRASGGGIRILPL
jgi:hypothetical protein